MTCNFILFFCTVFISINTFKDFSFHPEVSFIKIKAVGGSDSNKNEDYSLSTSANEDSDEEQDTSEDSSESSTYSTSVSSLSTEENISVFISPGNDYFEECIAHNVCTFKSFSNLVKFLLFEVKYRKLNAHFSDCQKVISHYLKYSFTPNTSVNNELVVNVKDLILLLIKYIRTEGRSLQSLTSRKQSKQSMRESRSDSKTHDDSDSEADSSSEPNTKSRFNSIKSTETSFISEGSSHGIKHSSDNASSMQPKRHVSEGDSENIPFKPKDSIADSKKSNNLEENLEKDSTLKQEFEPKEITEMKENEILEEVLNIEYESDQPQDQISPEMVVQNLDLSSRGTIPLAEIEMEIDLEDPWKNLITMMLYEPVRRSSLLYREGHCNKMVKTTGRIIAYLIKVSCKLRLSLSEYNRKKCSEKSKISRLFMGCHKLRMNIKQYINLYSKFRYDLVDSIVAITQCSIAKNNYLSQIDQVFLGDSEDSQNIHCTLKEYYFSLDFYLFLSFITNAYDSAKEKLEQFISNSCESACSSKCGKKSQICLCLEHSYNNLFADKINMQSYNFHLNKKINSCKNYLINNYLYSNKIPESAEYVSASGNRYKLEKIDHIQTVQFPRIYPSNLEKLSILKSNLFSLLLTPPINSQEQLPQTLNIEEKSTKGDFKQKSKPKFNLKLIQKKSAKKTTSKNNNAQRHLSPPDPQAHSKDSWT